VVNSGWRYVNTEWNNPSITCYCLVNDKHQFKMSELLYRFRYDDGTFRVKYEGSDLLARVSWSASVCSYSMLHSVSSYPRA